jgi:hypothetical protein
MGHNLNDDKNTFSLTVTESMEIMYIFTTCITHFSEQKNFKRKLGTAY